MVKPGRPFLQQHLSWLETKWNITTLLCKKWFILAVATTSGTFRPLYLMSINCGLSYGADGNLNRIQAIHRVIISVFILYCLSKNLPSLCLKVKAVITNNLPLPKSGISPKSEGTVMMLLNAFVSKNISLTTQHILVKFSGNYQWTYVWHPV